MALGFFGVFLGTLVQARCYCPQTFSMDRPFKNQMLLSFSIVLFVCTYGGYFATQGVSETGGWVGITHVIGALKSLAIVPPMLYLWRIKTKLWMTHPVMLGLLAWGAVVGIFSTGKQEAMEPLVFYVLVGFFRYGFRDMRLWSLISLGAVYYGLIIFPYSQYVRSNGGREGSFAERSEVTKDAFLNMASDEDFRDSVTERVSKGHYFDPSLSAFSRLAMVAEADRLIYATEQQQAFTGWETITWGFKLVTPSFLYPEKPVFESANYLSHIAGETAVADTTTQVSYGAMANLYNAFALTGVLIGTPLFFGAFYYWIRLFLGNPRWENIPTTSTLWFMWLMAIYQHRLAESTLSGLIASLSFPSVIILLFFFAKWLCLLLPADVESESTAVAESGNESAELCGA
jgi:hypothetical protein